MARRLANARGVRGTGDLSAFVLVFHSYGGANVPGYYYQVWQHEEHTRLSVRIHGIKGEVPARTIHIEGYEAAHPVEDLETAMAICRENIVYHYSTPKRKMKIVRYRVVFTLDPFAILGSSLI